MDIQCVYREHDTMYTCNSLGQPSILGFQRPEASLIAGIPEDSTRILDIFGPSIMIPLDFKTMSSNVVQKLQTTATRCVVPRCSGWWITFEGCTSVLWWCHKVTHRFTLLSFTFTLLSTSRYHYCSIFCIHFTFQQLLSSGFDHLISLREMFKLSWVLWCILLP